MLAQYTAPTIVDYGDLTQLTAACIGDGNLDETFKGDENPFQYGSAAFGDEAFCIQ
jgi:hypothetical protein